MKTLLYISALLLVFGCRPVKQVESFTQTKSDSITYIEVVRDSIITIKGDNVFIPITEVCDSTGIVRQFERIQKGNGKATVTIKSNPATNSLMVECLCSEEQLMIEKLSREIRQLRASDTKENKETTITKVERFIPFYARFQWYLLAVVVAYVAGAFRVHKLIFNAIKTLF